MPGRLRRCRRGPQMVDACRLGRRRRRGPAADLPARVPQLRHDLRAGLGTRTGARREPRLRRRPAPHPAPARRPARPADDAPGRWRDRCDDGHRLPLARPRRLPRLPPRHPLVRPPDRRPRRGLRPHPRPLPIQRTPRLRGPPLHSPRPGSPPDRDQPPKGRLARPSSTHPGRPTPPRGMAVFSRVSGLPAVRLPQALQQGSRRRGQRTGWRAGGDTPRTGGYSKTRSN